VASRELYRVCRSWVEMRDGRRVWFGDVHTTPDQLEAADYRRASLAHTGWMPRGGGHPDVSDVLVLTVRDTAKEADRG
jgi:hypothetical protein